MILERLLSIIVPAYNVEKFLKKTLDSCEIHNTELLTQYEVIIINDGSTDNTHNISMNYVNKYKDTQTFRILDKNNGGYGSTINMGISVAKGKYVKILDGDDWYNTIALEKFISLLTNAKSDAILTDYTSIDDLTGTQQLCCYTLEPNTIQKIEDCYIPPKDFNMHGICYQKKFFEQYNIKITEHCFYTDTEFLLYPFLYVKTIQYYTINLYQYRVGREGQSISTSGVLAHILDHELLIKNMNTYFAREIPEQKKLLIDGRIAIVYDSYIRGLLLSSCCKKNYHKLQNFICLIKNNYPERYKIIVNKKTILLEKSNYLIYLLCCIWHRKIECSNYKYLAKSKRGN